MSSAKKAETKSEQSKNDNFAGLRSQLVDGVDVMLRMHNDWLDIMLGQHTKLFTALREGVGHIEKAVGQATDRYRKVSEAWSVRLSEAAHRTV